MIKGLVEGLENIRREKIRKQFEESCGAIQLRNITSYETNRLRTPLSRMASMVDRLSRSDVDKNLK